MNRNAKNFMKCGLMGWGLECFWTGLGSVCIEKNKKMTCATSMWMFPIYGMASAISPLCHVMKNKNIFLRGSVYTACIFLTEYSTGSLLKKIGCCPWDYSKAKANYKGLVRFDYAPLWFAVGLLYEKILSD
ncbi:MAG: putative ABC transporter permease [Eubacterium sp.]|nr:putative ABC transporter permease [Eubacterium sp.]